MFALTLSLKRKLSSKTTPICERSECSVSPRTSRPSTSTAPRAGDRPPLPRLDAEVEALEHVAALVVAEVDVDEVDVAGDRRRVDRVGRVLDLRVVVEELEDPLAP